MSVSASVLTKFDTKTSMNPPEVIVIPVNKKGQTQAPVSKQLQQAIEFNIASHAHFKGDKGQTMEFAAPKGKNAKRIVLLGIGDADTTLDESEIREWGAKLYKAIQDTGYKRIEAFGLSSDEHSVILADAVEAAGYKFDKYMTAPAREPLSHLDVVYIIENRDLVWDMYRKLSAVTMGEFLAADVANEPGNKMVPAALKNKIEEELSDLPNVKLRILDTDQMAEENMGAALAVGQGSVNKPCMVVIEYDGTNGEIEGWPLALVGKGVTFDTGGISIKPSAGMGEMKMDMGGAAAVIGGMRALAGRKANAKVVAIVGLVENMPDGKAYRPGDIITSRAGLTIDVGNTDAEGRLVLADAMDYIQEKYKPGTMLDAATLTGACMAALAHEYTGVMTPSDELWQKIDNAGKESGQEGWRLPLGKAFSDAMKGKISDLSNMGSMRYAGASTAGAFLQNFVKEGVEWAHLDIAGTAIPANGISNGFGVRFFDRFVADNFEGNSKNVAAPKSKL